MTADEIAAIESSFLASKIFYVITLVVFISPIVIRESLAELKMNTYIIGGGVISMILIMITLLFKNGSYDYRVQTGVITDATHTPESAIEGISPTERVMDSVNIAVASQGFIINFFPIYSAMKKSERPKILYSVLGGLSFTTTTYTILGLLSLSYFGIQNI